MVGEQLLHGLNARGEKTASARLGGLLAKCKQMDRRVDRFSSLLEVTAHAKPVDV